MRFVLVILAFSLGGGGCSPAAATIDQSWRSPQLRSHALTNVVTLAPDRYGVRRRTVEAKLARALTRRRMRATPAYTVLTPDQLRDQITTSDALRGAGFDGIVLMRFVGQTEIEADAYSLPQRRVVWATRSRSLDPISADSLLDHVTDVVSHELDRERVIARSK